MAMQPARVFYRIVLTDPPTVADFESRQAKGLPPRGAELRRPELYRGLSLYATEVQAGETARRFPALGNFIAAVAIPVNGPFRVEQTLRPGHYTLWGEPEDLLAAVVATVPIAWPEEGKDG